jgi:transposase
VCEVDSQQVHSVYEHAVFDLPWHGVAVSILVRARRFFCDHASCERRIFCERLPGVSARARKTNRLEETLLAIALKLGGRAGARLASELGLLVGRDALLPRAKNVAPVAVEDMRILGIDDFAFKKATPTEPCPWTPNAARWWTCSRVAGRKAS